MEQFTSNYGKGHVATTSFYPKIWINRVSIPLHLKGFPDLNMARTKGARNKKTLLREAEQKRLAANGNSEVLVDCLHVMEKAMRHFYFKAVREQERGDKADQIVVDAAFNQAATLAEKVAPYRHPRLAAMKLAGDPNNPLNGMTAEELRADIMTRMRELGMFEGMVPLPAPAPEGVVHNGRQREGSRLSVTRSGTAGTEKK